MSDKYPEVIDLAKYAHISDTEIAQDIADTEREIDAHLKGILAQDALAATSDGGERKMAFFRADNHRYNRDRRLAFVDFLKRVQAARAQALVGGGVPEGRADP